MIKKLYVLLAMLIIATMITSCAKKEAEETPVTAPETTAETSAPVEKEPETENPYAFYENFDGYVYGFLSGVGAWETELRIKPDGSFEGQFYDSNMGETGEGYDNGTIYECTFNGKLSVPEKKDDDTYTASVEALEFDRSDFEGKESYIDDYETLHVAADSYGIGKGDKLIFYGPKTKLNETTEGFQQWVYWQFYGKADDVELGEYGIYNETQDTGFFPDHYAMGDAEEFYGPYEEPETELYGEVKNAYENQCIPQEIQLTSLPMLDGYVSDEYYSVTLSNLQGTWVNEYKEGEDEIVEILQVNGERGKIESYINGQPSMAWNDEGFASIEDRTSQGKCPAFRINDDFSGNNICTIYIRWVKDESFYDGGFLNEWEKVETNEESFLIDTVTMDNLQGVWYSEYVDGGGFYQDVLTIEGDQATLLETVNGEPSKTWNKKGSAWLTSETIEQGRTYPELLIKDEEHDNGTAGIYISHVSSYSFFDQGFFRYWMKVPKEIGPYWGELD